MPIVHAPAGSPKGGQFAPGGQSQSQPPPKASPAAQKYLAATHKAIMEDQSKAVPHLTGSKKEIAAETKYLKALHRENHRKVALNARTIKKVQAAQKAAAKKQAAAALKAKKVAAAKAALAARPVKGRVATPSTAKPFKPGTKKVY